MTQTTMTAEGTINTYSKKVAQRDQLILDMQAKCDDLIPQEIKDQIEDVKFEIMPDIELLNVEILAYETKLREYVLAVGKTLANQHHMFMWSKGRVSWDTKSLEGYAKAHPELLVFRKTGQPSVSVRKVK